MQRQRRKGHLEVREDYYRKANEAREKARIDPDVWLRMWHQLVVDNEWSFDDAMKFLEFALDINEPAIGVHFSIALSQINAIWKHWFFTEFPDFVSDLKLKQTDRGIPFPWVEVAREHAVALAPRQKPNDALFYNVPWRSCYMWARMYRRMCGKYYAEFFVMIARLYAVSRSIVPVMVSDQAARDSVVVKERDGRTVVTIHVLSVDDGNNAEQNLVFETHKMTVDDALIALFPWMQPIQNLSIVSRVWIARQLYCALTETSMNSKTKEESTLAFEMIHTFRDAGNGKFFQWVLLRHFPNVGKDRGKRGRYAYTFSPESIHSFILWYLATMVNHGDLPDVLTPNMPLLTKLLATDTVLEKTATGHRFFELPIKQGARRTDILIDDPKTGKESWHLLETVGLFPKRIDTQDPEGRAIQFLGARELHGK